MKMDEKSVGSCVAVRSEGSGDEIDVCNNILPWHVSGQLQSKQTYSVHFYDTFESKLKCMGTSL